MEVKELASKLNGIEYRNEIPRDLSLEAKTNGLVIVYGYSDDLMEFEGAINDEVSAWDGGTAYINTSGLLTSDCDDEGCPYFKQLQEKARQIKAVWCPRKDGEVYASWLIKTDIPHKAFDVMEDGELYCRGIVFSLNDAE